MASLHRILVLYLSDGAIANGVCRQIDSGLSRSGRYGPVFCSGRNRSAVFARRARRFQQGAQTARPSQTRACSGGLEVPDHAFAPAAAAFLAFGAAVPILLFSCPRPTAGRPVGIGAPSGLPFGKTTGTFGVGRDIPDTMTVRHAQYGRAVFRCPAPYDASRSSWRSPSSPARRSCSSTCYISHAFVTAVVMVANSARSRIASRSW